MGQIHLFNSTIDLNRIKKIAISLSETTSLCRGYLPANHSAVCLPRLVHVILEILLIRRSDIVRFYFRSRLASFRLTLNEENINKFR